MKLNDSDILTKEVLDWRGLHLFHGQSSTCSQKVRIFLNLKGAKWESHLLDFTKGENISKFYLGINPRGLVPAIVHDGAVHIESNDILIYLEEIFPEPELIPPMHRSQIADLLRHEDDLHLALRTASFRFLFAPEKPPKSEDDLGRYAQFSSGTVGGVRDERIDAEILYWRAVLECGIGDEEARQAVKAFTIAFEEIDARLREHDFLFGNSMTVLDIAWLVYVNRMMLAGYPMVRLHPNLGRWAKALGQHPAFRDEIALPKPLADLTKRRQQILAQQGADLVTVCGL